MLTKDKAAMNGCGVEKHYSKEVTSMTQNEAILKVLTIARAEIGYHEKASNRDLDWKTTNSGSGNYTKYARDLDAIQDFYNGKKQGAAWCDMFYDWLHVKAWGAETAKKVIYQPSKSSGAGCLYSARYYMAQKMFFHNPKPGDQIFFLSGAIIGHTGIVESVSDKEVVTIEGNSGDRVARHVYKLNNLNIAGYGRPNWALAASTSSTLESRRRLKKGCKGEDVKQLQRDLISFGYNLPKWGADGSFGNETLAAVKRFQLNNGLVVDGIVGPKTFAVIDRLKGDKNGK